MKIGRGIPVSASTHAGDERTKISAPGRISRQIGASVSLTFIFRNRARARVASPRYCRCKSGITLDIAPWVYIPSDIFRTTNIFAGFYEASSGKRIYGGTSQCIRFPCFPIRRDCGVISLYRYANVSDKHKFYKEVTRFPKFYSLLAHDLRLIKTECMSRIRITIRLHKNCMLKDIKYSEDLCPIDKISFLMSLGNCYGTIGKIPY